MIHNIILLQLKEYLSPGEYGLSIDTDVALWIESRTFSKKPPLRELIDFIIVNKSPHDKFDEFKRRETHREYSILSINNLLQHWNSYERNSSSPVIMIYGKPHLKLHYSDVDELCQWVLDQKENEVIF